jgi:hypothetical protein
LLGLTVHAIVMVTLMTRISEELCWNIDGHTDWLFLPYNYYGTTIFKQQMVFPFFFISSFFWRIYKPKKNTHNLGNELDNWRTGVAFPPQCPYGQWGPLAFSLGTHSLLFSCYRYSFHLRMCPGCGWCIIKKRDLFTFHIL